MADDRNDNVKIAHPEVWRLALRLSDRRLAYALYSRVEDRSLAYGTLEYRDAVEQYVRELEATVYDHAFLLQQYERTDVLIESLHFLLVPDEFSCGGNVDECGRYFRFIYPHSRCAVLADHIEEAGVSVVYGVDNDVEGFVRRTFGGLHVMHFMTPIIRYFLSKEKEGNQAGKMFVYLAEGMVEVVGMRDGRLVLANCFPFRTADDALYYVLNAWQQCGMDAHRHEMYVTGDKGLRKLLLPELRKYIATVVQTIFPAPLLRMGKEAMSAPFDLIILPLCE